MLLCRYDTELLLELLAGWKESWLGCTRGREHMGLTWILPLPGQRTLKREGFLEGVLEGLGHRVDKLMLLTVVAVVASKGVYEAGQHSWDRHMGKHEDQVGSRPWDRMGGEGTVCNEGHKPRRGRVR